MFFSTTLTGLAPAFNQSDRNLALCVVASGALLVFQPISTAVAQSASPMPPEWIAVVRGLQFRRDSIDSAKGYFLVARYESERTRKELEEETRREWKRSLEQAASIPPPQPPEWAFINEEVVLYFWASRGDRWYCEAREVYPEKASPGRRNLTLSICDGERAFVYDEYGNRGRVTLPAEGWHPSKIPHFPSLRQGGVPFLGLAFPLDALERAMKRGACFQAGGKEEVRGEACLKFFACELAKTWACRIITWVSPAKGCAVVKFTHEQFGVEAGKAQTNRGSLFLYIVDAFEEVKPGLFLPVKARRETYRIDGSQLIWERTREFRAQGLEVNFDASRESVFSPRFPPGARVHDEISNPGQLTLVGPNSHHVVEDLKHGRRTVPELPAEGYAPPSPQDFSTPPSPQK